MGINSSIPWTKINDYLAEVGSSENADEFIGRTLHNIDQLIPFDINGLFVTVDATGKFLSWQSVIEYEKWFQLFTRHYWRFMPDAQDKILINTDWNQFRNNQFVNDFLTPQGIRYSMGVFHLGNMPNQTASFALLRSRKCKHFNEIEQAICKILQPHLANLFSLVSKINHSGHQIHFHAELVKDSKLFSKRETEVAVLLCQRLTAAEIATKLMISRRTVEFHIINIYEKMKVRTRRELLMKLMGIKQ